MVMKTFQIFKAGTFTAMAGQTLNFSEHDIARMAAAYSENKRPANLVLGHPGNDLPAYGAVKKLFNKDGILYAIADVTDALIGLVRKGAYLNVSAAFITPSSPENPEPGYWFLRHVGFLGAMGPAVKGLADLNFSERGGVCFSETGGVCFAQAVTTTDRREQSTKAMINCRTDPDRLALHEAAMCFMESVPGASYHDALTQLAGAGMCR